MYLALLTDKMSRKIVGYHCGESLEATGCVRALEMALEQMPEEARPIHHSDRGSQYCSKAYQRLIKVMGLRCSMGRRANCYDNAAMESFFHSLKVELIHRERYATRQAAKAANFEYIEVYYNRKRKHSAIGHQIPMLFEQESA